MSEIKQTEGEAQSEFEESYSDHHEFRGELFMESLGSIPQRPLLTLPTNMSVAGAIRAMNENHCGCALIVRNGKLAGIFTERDVLRRVVASGIDLDDTPVERVMTANPDTLPATATIAFALKKMCEEGYRHIPLVDAEGRPTGVVAVRDIVGWMVELFPESVLNLPPNPGAYKSPDGG